MVVNNDLEQSGNFAAPRSQRGVARPVRPGAAGTSRSALGFPSLTHGKLVTQFRSRWPGNWHANRLSLFLPSCRTPFPVGRSSNQTRPNRIGVHILKLFHELMPTPEIKSIITSLPDWITRRSLLEVFDRLGFE